MAKRSKLKAAKGALPKAGRQVHDRRASDIPLNAHVGVVEIIDAYGEADPAEQTRHEWRIAEPAKVLAIQSFRKDPIGKMFARRQISDVEYKTARMFQELYERAEIGSIKAMDPGKPYVDGGTIPEVLTDTQRKAVLRMKAVSGAVVKQHGRDGMTLLEYVLAKKMTIGEVAAVWGDTSDKRIDFWCVFFRRCLHTLGIELGLVSYPQHIVGRA